MKSGFVGLTLSLLLSSTLVLAAPSRWEIDVDIHDAFARSDLEASLGARVRTCLETPRFEARANGFGSLLLVVDRAGEVRDARYLGFDHEPSADQGFATADLQRKQRAAFDDLGACLRSAAVGARISGHPSAPASAFVWFVPPR